MPFHCLSFDLRLFITLMVSIQINVRRKPNKGNQEWTTQIHRQHCAQDTERRQTKKTKHIIQKILMISNTTLQYKTGVNKGDRECKQFLILKMKPVVARTYSQVR